MVTRHITLGCGSRKGEVSWKHGKKTSQEGGREKRRRKRCINFGALPTGVIVLVVIDTYSYTFSTQGTCSTLILLCGEGERRMSVTGGRGAGAHQKKNHIGYGLFSSQVGPSLDLTHGSINLGA